MGNSPGSSSSKQSDAKDTEHQCSPTHRRGVAWLALGVVAAGATIGALVLRDNIAKHKQESSEVAFRTVDLDETTVDPAIWGRDFPHQFDSYRRTVDTERTRHGGSESYSHLEESPVWREIWAGYAFAIDFREDRGHAFMLDDQRNTERVKQRKQPGACLHCHASAIPAYRQRGIEAGAAGSILESLTSTNGQAQLMKGFGEVCKMPYADATQLVTHPVACLDCHDPETTALRVTRPGMIEGLAALAAGDAATPHLPSIERWRKGGRDANYNPNALASRQEMRALVCGQCHVEYYFTPDAKRVTYPWQYGLKVEDAERYYNAINFNDWTHTVSKAPLLKAQHPEFEMWSQGVHARMGVTCADCHMPYQRLGAVKVSSHHVRSPLLNMSTACLNCHPTEEATLIERVALIQDTTKALLIRAETATVELIRLIAAAETSGASLSVLTEARAMQRAAQFRLDWVSAENSMGFHAPQEAARILGESIDFARKGMMALAGQTATAAVASTPSATPALAPAKS
jgi:nitrite reductase (cytochrome c-552)